MHSLRIFLLLVTLLATFAFSAPAPVPRNLNKRSFSVPRIRRSDHRHHARSGVQAMAKAYRKYGWTLMGTKLQDSVPERENVTDTTNENGQVSAVPERNTAEFLSPVTIGGQQFNLDIDTGSSDLWVFSTSLSSNVIGQHSAFDPTQSQTFNKIQGATFRIKYGDKSGASGTVGIDTVDIGGATVAKQAVELATTVTGSFIQDTNNDGLVGLAFSQINTVRPQKQKTFFDNIMGDLEQPVFTADLRSDSSGTYTFGTIDMTKAKGPLTDVPVDAASGFWQVTSDFAMVGDKQLPNTAGTPAIADTGTSLLLVNDDIARGYYAEVQGAQEDQGKGGFVYPCDTKLPDFSFKLGDYLATVPGDQMTFAKVGSGTCFGGMQSNGGSPLQIYGDTMFKTQFVVFDGGNGQLRIAPKA